MERSKRVEIYYSMVMSMLAMAMVTMATIQDDEKDCADQLTNLATCIPFVSGTAKKPTPECCDDTKKLRSAKPKCLCVLIKESTDSSLGLPINTTLALQMPSACNIDAKVSDCPSILKLPADSPDAKIFKDASEDSSSTPTTDSPPVSASSSSFSPSSGSSSSSKATPSSNGGSNFVANLSTIIMGLVSLALIMLV